jgi:ribonucleotide monophosphatase NagD (HAD superfamily)
MPKLIRRFAAVVYIAFLAVSGILASTGSAMTEDQVASPVKQTALTKKQIEGVLAAQKEMDEINVKLSEKAKPYLIVAEQLESVAKKNGFASYDEYTDVVDNVSIVLAGFDPVTKKYTGVRLSLERRSPGSKPTKICQPRIKRRRSPRSTTR